MLEIDSDNFEKEVKQSDRPVLLDFWGPKCEPCKALIPDLEKLAAEYKDEVKFCKLNTAENRRLAISQKVLGLPTVILYKHGEKAEELTQAEATLTNIREMLNRHAQ